MTNRKHIDPTFFLLSSASVFFEIVSARNSSAFFVNDYAAIFVLSRLSQQMEL
jgi:hypothetical protein